MRGRNLGSLGSWIFAISLSGLCFVGCGNDSEAPEKSASAGGGKSAGNSTGGTSTSLKTSAGDGGQTAPGTGTATGTQSGGATVTTEGGAATSGGSTTNTLPNTSAGSAGSPPTSTAPATGGASTTAGGTTANSETGGAPSSNGGAPASNGGAPSSNGGAPSSNGGAPSSNGGAPSSNGGAPSSNGGTTTGVAGSGVTTGGAPAALCSTFASPVITGTLFAEASGISGVAASLEQAGVLWIHSDRQKILYGVDATGKLLGQWEVSTGAKYFFIYNWEDIAVQAVNGGPDKIWIGDIGNNYVRGGGDPRTSIRIMSILEPSIDPSQTTVGTVTVVDDLEFTYPDGLHDAEAMAMDPLTGDLYVFAKEEDPPSKIFRAKAPLTSGVFEEIGSIDSYWLNAADFSASGRELLVRNYGSVLYWSLPNGKTWLETIVGAPTKESRLKFTDGYYGEALGFSADESGFYVVSEQEEEATASPVEFYAKNCK